MMRQVIQGHLPMVTLVAEFVLILMEHLKGGGFEVTRDADTKFRVDIGPTSFYDVTRYSPQQRTWIEWN